MSKKGATGSAVKPKLIEQIKIRENVQAASNKTAEQLKYLNSSTAWVKLRSSVNQVDPQQIKDLDKAILNKDEVYKIKSDHKIAQNFVLMGGSRRTSDSNPYGQERAGVSSQRDVLDPKSAYNNFSGEYGLGFRPMPGITGLNICLLYTSPSPRDRG